MTDFSVDLHVHTSASPDGRSSLQALAAAAKAKGLHALAVTDHNLCTPVPAELDGVLLIPGCEVSTQAGHITGLFLERPLDLDMTGPLPPPEAAVDAIHQAGGLAALAHPYQKPGAEPERLALPLDALETVNARAAFKVPDANRRAARRPGLVSARCGRRRRPRRRGGGQRLHCPDSGGAVASRPAPGAAGRRQGRAVPGHPPCAEGTVPVDKGPAYRTVPPSKSGVVPGLLCRP